MSARPEEHPSDQYLSETVLRACKLIQAFNLDREVLSLKELAARTGLNKTTAFRLLRSLERGGVIECTAAGHYRTSFKPVRRLNVRLGYAGQSAQSAFSREITTSVIQAAEDEGIEIVALDNGGSRKLALENADKLLKARVNLVIEHQQYEQIAETISSKLRDQGIPLIAISFPHPGAVYYGPHNFQAGTIGGRALGNWARHHFDGEVEEILLVEREFSGPWLQARLKGVETGIREALPAAQQARILRIEGGGEFNRTSDAVHRYLRNSRAKKILVGTINDASALGALCAFHEFGRTDDCAIMGQSASAEVRAELRRPGTRLIGSVGYFPERYGHDLVMAALKILAKKAMPPAVFVRHHLITPKNVNEFYPQDIPLLSTA
jgi:ribose transport system substrate-binding protein